MAGRKRSKDLRRIMRIAEGGDAATAILLLRRRVDADPTAVEARECLAEVLLQSGDAPSALSEGRTALGLDPSSGSAANVAAAAALRAGRAGVVIDFGRELVAARPDDPNAYRALMRLSVGVGNLYEAAVAAEWLVDNSLDAGEAVAVLHDIARQTGLDDEDVAANAVAHAVDDLLDEPPYAEEVDVAVEPVGEAALPTGVEGVALVAVSDDEDASMPVELVPAVPPRREPGEGALSDPPEEMAEAAGSPLTSEPHDERVSPGSSAEESEEDAVQLEYRLRDLLVPVPDVAATQPRDGATVLEEDSIPDEQVPQVPPAAVDTASPTAAPAADAWEGAPIVPPVPEVLAGELGDLAAGERERMSLAPTARPPRVRSTEAGSGDDLRGTVPDDPALFVPPIPGAPDEGAEEGDEPTSVNAGQPATDVPSHGDGPAEPDPERVQEDHPEGSTEDERSDASGDGPNEEAEGGGEDIDLSRFDEPDEIDLRPLTSRGSAKARRRINAT